MRLHCCLLIFAQCFSSLAAKPHIVFVVADDLGWDDVGWQGSEIKTPVLDQMAHEGVILNQSYVQPVCSPTRSAFMSGRFPYHTGLQRGVISPPQPYGLPLNITSVAQHLKSAGYSTHAIGKWHLGFCKWEYTPTERGFDTFFGYYEGAEDYYTHRRSYPMSKNKEAETGLDFRRNRDIMINMNGTYSSSAFADEAVSIISQHSIGEPLYLYLPFQAVHEPLQVPQRFIDMYPHIKNETRCMKAAMVTAMDEAIGNVTAALKQKQLWNNTLFVFTTDNGGPVQSGASNWPLRGSKATLWEGGTRGLAFVHGAMLNQTGYVNNELIHAVDWYPTLLNVAGVTMNDANLDGMNVWNTLSHGAPSPRNMFVYNLVGSENSVSGAIRYKNWKLLVNPGSKHSGWYPPANSSFPENLSLLNDTVTGNDMYYLFDLAADPTERNNLADSQADVLAMMKSHLSDAMKTYVTDLSSLNPPTEKSNPSHFGDVWSPGWC